MYSILAHKHVGYLIICMPECKHISYNVYTHMFVCAFLISCTVLKQGVWLLLAGERLHGMEYYMYMYIGFVCLYLYTIGVHLPQMTRFDTPLTAR